MRNEAVQAVTGESLNRTEVQGDEVSEASEESFPASDAPSWTTSTASISAAPARVNAKIPSATGEISPRLEACAALERGTGLAIGTR